jgi:hypothetical protein
VKGEDVGSGNSSTKFQLWVWTIVPYLYTAWMEPLVRVTYSGLTQSVLRLDRVKSSSSDYHLSSNHLCGYQ